MQASAQTFKAATGPHSVAARGTRRASAPVRCQQGLPQAIKEVAQGATVAAAAFALVVGTGLPAQAAKPEPSDFEKKQAYQAELLAALKARGKELPSVTSAPEGVVDKSATIEPLKFKAVEKVKIEAPPTVPAPEAPAPAPVAAPAPAPVVVEAPAPAPVVVEAPKPAPVVVEAPKPAPVVVEAPKPAPAPAAPAPAPVQAAAPAAAEEASANPAENKGLVAGAAIATVAILAVAGAGTQGNLEGVVAGSPAPPATRPAPAGGADGVPPNVAEARAWIANWRAKSGAAASAASGVPPNVAEARAWIAAWKAKHQKA